MADGFVQLSPDSTGKKMDTRTEATNAEHRQVMVIGDPATNAGVAPVDSVKGVAVDLSQTGSFPAIPAGTNIIGKVTTDQTTHGTTDLVAADITKVAGSAISQGHGTAAAA